MLLTLEQLKQMDRIVLEEVNVKEFVRRIGVSDRGDVHLVFDGDDYFIRIDGKRVKAPRTVDFLVKRLCDVQSS